MTVAHLVLLHGLFGSSFWQNIETEYSARHRHLVCLGHTQTTPSHTNTDKINKAETPGLKTGIWCFDALHANKSWQERNSQTIRHYASEQWHWDNKIRRDWVELKSRHPSDNDGLTCDIPPLLSGSWAGHMTRPPCSYAPPAPSTAEHCNTPQTPAILTE